MKFMRHFLFSFGQNKRLKTYIGFKTQKRSQITSEFENDVYKILNICFFSGEIMKNVQNRTAIEIIKQDDHDKFNQTTVKTNF